MPRRTSDPLITNLSITRKDFTITVATDKHGMVTAMFRGKASFVNSLTSNLHKRLGTALVPLMGLLQAQHSNTSARPEDSIDDKIAANKKLPLSKRLYGVRAQTEKRRLARRRHMQAVRSGKKA